MLQQTTPIASEAVNKPEVVKAYLTNAEQEAIDSFWEYRVYMNPRLTLRGKWFPRSLAWKLRKFWDDFRAGKRPIMLLMTPPQHGKSLTVIDFISWAVGHDPELRVIYSSFSDRLGVRANLRLQRVLDSANYRRIFPETRLSDSHVERYLCNHEVLEFVEHDGYFRNTTVLGSITGEALDLSVIDDPIKGRAEASSEVTREKTWNWLTDDVFSRFSERAALLMIMTRWHVDDPAGRLLERFGDRVTVARYPALAEQRELYRDVGEPLFPELKSLDFLLERRKLYTEASWAALYQQNPFIVGGGIFPIDKLVPLQILDRTRILKSVRYWDKAGTEDGGAYTAGIEDCATAEQISAIRVAPLCDPARLIVGFGFMEHGYAKLARGTESFAAILHALGPMRGPLCRPRMARTDAQRAWGARVRRDPRHPDQKRRACGKAAVGEACRRTDRWVIL
jgi:hypothetical protein